MSAYHQMGHDSENLLSEEGLRAYRGAILSPVNYNVAKIVAQVQWARQQEGYATIFDPQLYVPTSDRGCLREWSYFPSDVDSADLSSEAWWSRLLDALVATCIDMSPAAVCSPVVLPNAYTDDYFTRIVSVGDGLCAQMTGTTIRPMQSAVVGLQDLGTPDRAMTIASILSRCNAGHVYLVFVGVTEPRRELNEIEEIKGAMKLIAALGRAGLEVTVGFTSSDIVLWKAAGAAHCATGKFFNLRRFTRTRFEEPGQGGGQLPYWYEESLMAFLRQSDLARVVPLNLPHLSPSPNPFGEQIIAQLRSDPSKAWLALAWRQFMFWFADVEDRLNSRLIEPATLLRTADTNWRTLEDVDFLMEERRNDGIWVRQWRRALAEYRVG
jgi:hypothetical protein